MKLFAAPRGRLLACASVAAALSGCAGVSPFTSAAVDPSSAVAARVEATARANKTYPKFSDIPPAPSDVRAPRAWGQAAVEVEAERQSLEQATGPATWSLTGTEGFAAQAKAEVGAEVADDPAAAAATEAFARQTRARATPPPPPKR